MHLQQLIAILDDIDAKIEQIKRHLNKSYTDTYLPEAEYNGYKSARSNINRTFKAYSRTNKSDS